MPLDVVIPFRALRVRQRQCVGFEAFPHCIQQFGFSRRRRDSLLVVASRSLCITLARFPRSGKGAFLAC